jgi:hypothetical protein
MNDIETAEKFIDNLRIAEQYGGAVVVPECIRDWKKLDDDSYIVIMNEVTYYNAVNKC